MRVCVIFNPVAKGDKARRLHARLDDIGRHASLKSTRSAGDARNLAREAVQEGFETVVAVGGDGTVNEVLNGIGDITDGFEKTRLGVVPLGTVNVFARELRLPMKLDAAWEIVLKGREAHLDLAYADHGPTGAEQRRWFAQLAGVGLDARAIELVNWNLKKIIGPLAYVYAGLKALIEKKPGLLLSSGGISLEGQLVLIGNGRLYGGNFATFEQAQMDDGLLDVCVFPRVNLLTLLRCAGPLLLAGTLPESVVKRCQSSAFTVNGPATASFELDGELVGRLPVKFGVARRRLRMIVP